MIHPASVLLSGRLGPVAGVHTTVQDYKPIIVLARAEGETGKNEYFCCNGRMSSFQREGSCVLLYTVCVRLYLLIQSNLVGYL